MPPNAPARATPTAAPGQSALATAPPTTTPALASTRVCVSERSKTEAIFVSILDEASRTRRLPVRDNAGSANPDQTVPAT